jgi:LPXTG-motif cell wall-anchored protein
MIRRLFVLLAATGLLLTGAIPALAQPSPVEEVAPIVVDRPPAQPAVPVEPVAGAPSVDVAPAAPVARTVRVAGADQLARTGIDTTTAVGAAAVLLILGGAAVYATRRKALTA